MGELSAVEANLTAQIAAINGQMEVLVGESGQVRGLLEKETEITQQLQISVEKGSRELQKQEAALKVANACLLKERRTSQTTGAELTSLKLFCKQVWSFELIIFFVCMCVSVNFLFANRPNQTTMMCVTNSTMHERKPLI